MRQLTPTQIQIIERRKAFHAAIAARAVPDTWSETKKVQPFAIVVDEPETEAEAPPAAEPQPEPQQVPASPEIYLTPGITVSKIYKAVCWHYGLSRAEFMSRCREQRIVNARYVAFYLARHFLKLSFPTIARTIVSGVDHTSVMHGIQKITKLIRDGHPIADDVKTLAGIIGGKHGLDF